MSFPAKPGLAEETVTVAIDEKAHSTTPSSVIARLASSGFLLER